MAKKINIEDFHGIDAKIAGIDKAIQKASSKTTDDLRRNPYQTWETHRRRNLYDNGWRYDMTEISKTYHAGTVRNETNWQLTWLLENGHLVTSAKGGVGWASPHRHIHRAFEENREEFIQDMANLDIKVSVH